MHQRSPVRWWLAVLMILYMTGSRMFRLPEAMSILARRTREPSSNSPARMPSKRRMFSSTVRSRHGLSMPGSVRVPLYCLISSLLRSST